MVLRVALDGEPLLGRRTGIGNLCLWLLEALTAEVREGRSDLDVGVYAVTWRMRSELESLLPDGARLIGRPVPARPARRAWDAGIRVPLEWFTGRLDVVHGTNFTVPPTRRAARVVSVHDLTPLHFPEMCQAETLAYPGLIRRAVREGAWVHTDSRFVAEEVVEALGVPPERVAVVHPGPPPLPGTGVPPDIGGHPRYVLAIGTIEPRKDYPGLVRAFDAIAGDRPDVALVIAGLPGWGAEQLDAAVEASPYRSRIYRPGYVDDEALGGLLRAASVLAYPSRYEGFGFPPLQAMAVGVPVVATATGSIPEVTGDGACLVPPGEVDALAAALARMLDDRDSALLQVAAGRRMAGAFSWSSAARGMSRLYHQAAAATM